MLDFVFRTPMERIMASNTKQRKIVTKNKLKKQGRERKRALRKGSTPPFPIHDPERHAGLKNGGSEAAPAEDTESPKD